MKNKKRKFIFLLKEGKVDNKWRLTIPSAVVDRKSLMQEDEVFLTAKEKDGCLRIYFTEKDLPLFSRAPIVQVKTTQNKKGGQMRLIIPSCFRESTSFFYGRGVALVDLGQKLELWPRP